MDEGSSTSERDSSVLLLHSSHSITSVTTNHLLDFPISFHAAILTINRVIVLITTSNENIVVIPTSYIRMLQKA
jgi:hypothetical protein